MFMYIYIYTDAPYIYIEIVVYIYTYMYIGSCIYAHMYARMLPDRPGQLALRHDRPRPDPSFKRGLGLGVWGLGLNLGGLDCLEDKFAYPIVP